MTNPHEPTPEFERFLEWQVTSAMRRQTRFAEPPRPMFARPLGIAALAVVSMFIGAAGVAAAGRIHTNQEKQMLLAQQAAEVRLAQMQVDATKQAAELAKRQTEVGAAPPSAYADAERLLQLAVLALKRASLNSEEIGASGKAVQDDLAAPVLGPRDFVMERLQLDQQASAMAVMAATEKMKATRTRFEVGIASEVELAAAQSEMTRATIDARSIATLTDLRRQFVANAIKADDLKHQRVINATRAQLAIAEAELAAVKLRYALLEKRAAVGTTGEVDLLKAKVEMLTKEQDIALLKARIKTLEGR